MRSFTSSLFLLMAFIAAPAAQSAERAYDAAAFETALKAGQPVAVVFHADWCPTCRAQAPVLKELLLEPQRRELTLFVANFDSETALRKEFRVTKQSTIIVFKKGREVVRSTGDTQKSSLDSLLAAAGA